MKPVILDEKDDQYHNQFDNQSTCSKKLRIRRYGTHGFQKRRQSNFSSVQSDNQSACGDGGQKSNRELLRNFSQRSHMRKSNLDHRSLKLRISRTNNKSVMGRSSHLVETKEKPILTSQAFTIEESQTSLIKSRSLHPMTMFKTANAAGQE